MKRSHPAARAGARRLRRRGVGAAAPYPSRPIRLVIGFAPAGAADVFARALSDAFARELGQPVVVDNKPGNGSSIAADIVAKAARRLHAADRQPEQHSVNPALNPKLAYTKATCCRSRT